jgi:hypothetical protein
LIVAVAIGELGLTLHWKFVFKPVHHLRATDM